MIIAIGSTNPIKLQAVEEAIRDYPFLAQAKVIPVKVEPEVSVEPLSLPEIIQGAKNRARSSFNKCSSCEYSFGIESGLFEALGTRSGYLETSACCVYDGLDYYTGLSLGVEIPPLLLQLVLQKKMDLGQACYDSGITSKVQLGASEGLIGLLTRGRINRLQSTKICIITALVQLENKKWYNSS